MTLRKDLWFCTCLSLPVWGWPGLHHPCAASTPTSVSTRLQTDRDRDHSLFIASEHYSHSIYAIGRVTSYLFRPFLTTSLWQLTKPYCETLIGIDLLKIASLQSWLTNRNCKCDFVRLLSYIFVRLDTALVERSFFSAQGMQENY